MPTDSGSHWRRQLGGRTCRPFVVRMPTINVRERSIEGSGWGSVPVHIISPCDEACAPLRGSLCHRTPFLLAYRGFLSSSSLSHFRRSSLAFRSNRYGINRLMSGSSSNRGANSDVVVIIPFETLPWLVITPSIACTSSAVTTWPGLYALTWSNSRIELPSCFVAITSRPLSPLRGVSFTSSKPACRHAPATISSHCRQSNL